MPNSPLLSIYTNYVIILHSTVVIDMGLENKPYKTPITIGTHDCHHRAAPQQQQKTRAMCVAAHRSYNLCTWAFFFSCVCLCASCASERRNNCLSITHTDGRCVCCAPEKPPDRQTDSRRFSGSSFRLAVRARSKLHLPFCLAARAHACLFTVLTMMMMLSL